MSSRTRLALPTIVLSIVFLAACGNSVNKAVPPPSGGFSTSNLNGTYVFSTSGADASNLSIMLVGAFTASGSGTITGGNFSFYDGSIGGASGQAITGGSYTVTQDGRGQIQLANSSALGTVVLDFVLASSNNGFVTEYDGNGSGSGTLELQGTVSQSDIAGQSYAFFLSGAGSSGLLATAGALTLDSTGAVSTGVQDLTSFNTSSGIASTQAGLSIATSSTVSVGTGTAPGAAQISDVGGSAFSFDVYAISATHLKLLETDGIQWTVGDVFSQQSSLPSGTLAFTMAGVDTSVFPLALGGLLPVSSGAISGGVEDYNDAGTANSTSSVSGSFTALSGGRSVLTLSSFENGGANQLLGTYSFAAYPSTGGTLLLEIDQAGISGGTALAQTSTSFSSSSGYAVNLSAINTSSEEDDIAEFTATSSSFSGLIDLNDQGSTLFDQTFGGNYASLSTGRYSFSQTSQSGFSGNFYTVDGSTVLFLETDQNQVGIGAFAAQSTPTSSAAANMTHVDVVHPRLPAGRSARWQKK